MKPLSQLTIEADSAAAILSAPAQILVDEALLPALSQLDFDVRITVFDRSGSLRDPAAAGGRRHGGSPVRIDAVPHDVLAIVSGTAGNEAADALAATFEAADARPRPLRVSLRTDAADGPALRGELALHLVPLLVRRLGEAEATLSSREGELVELRRLVEWQALGLRRGREVVEAIGFETRALAYELAPGAQSLRPAVGDAPAIVQRLPVDLSGVSAVSLHLAERVEAEGRLVVGLARPDLQSAEARLEVDYGNLAVGWNEFRFPVAVGAAHGDAMLTIACMGQPGGAVPAFSLAADEVAGFGLVSPASGGSLAFRVWKGLSPRSFAETPPARLVRKSVRLDTAKLRSRVGYLEGAAAEAVVRRRTGLGPLVGIGNDGSLRLRVLADRPAVMHLRGVLPPDARTVRVTVRPVTVPPDAPILVGLMVPDGGTARDADAARQAVEKLLAECATGPMSGRPGALAKPLSGDRPVVLEVPAEAVGTSADLLLFVGANAASGVEVVANGLEVDTERRPDADRFAPFARRIPFPELKSRTTYVFGDGEAARVSASLGFPVLEVSDVENFMQTHPALDAVTGARVKGVLPTGLMRVGAKVGTVHPQGPLAEYALLVVRADAGVADPLAFAEAIAAFLETADAAKPEFVIAAGRVTLEAGRSTEFDLELDAPLDAAADLLCLVRTLSGHIGFAWCRWFALDVEVASPKANVPEAPPPAPAPRRRLFNWR